MFMIEFLRHKLDSRHNRISAYNTRVAYMNNPLFIIIIYFVPDDYLDKLLFERIIKSEYHVEIEIDIYIYYLYVTKFWKGYACIVLAPKNGTIYH